MYKNTSRDIQHMYKKYSTCKKHLTFSTQNTGTLREICFRVKCLFCIYLCVIRLPVWFHAFLLAWLASPIIAVQFYSVGSGTNPQEIGWWWWNCENQGCGLGPFFAVSVPCVHTVTKHFVVVKLLLNNYETVRVYCIYENISNDFIV